MLAVADHPGWVALPDPEVMNLARTERRAVVTNNLRAYRPLHADAITPGGPGHFGMVFMPGTYRRTKEDSLAQRGEIGGRQRAADCAGAGRWR